jgi:hypothetical protein
MPYVSKKDCDEMVKAERRYFDHKSKEMNLRKRYAEAHRDRILFEKTVSETKDSVRLAKLQQIEHSRYDAMEDSLLRSDDLRLEWNLAGWRCHGKRKDRLLDMIEEEKNEILKRAAAVEHASEVHYLKWESHHKEHHEQMLEKLESLLKETN